MMPRLAGGLLWAGGLGIGALVLCRIELPAVAAAIADVHPFALSVFAALSIVTHFVLVQRTAVWVAASGYAVGHGPLLGQRLAGFAVSYLTPGPQIGGEPVQVLLLSRKGVATSDAITITALDRLTEVSVNAPALTTLALYVAAQGVLPRGAMLVLAPLWIALVVIGIVYTRGGRPLRALARAGSRLPARWAHALAASEARALGLVARDRRALGIALSVSCVAWGFAVVETWLVAALVGVSLDFPATLTVLVLVRFAILLPVPAGLGAFEAAHVLGFQLAGAAGEPALAMAALVRARDLIAVLAGLGWVAICARRLRRGISAAAAPVR